MSRGQVDRAFDKTNETFYKFRRGAQRAVKQIDASQLKHGTRVFSALHSNEYEGPCVLSFEIKESNTTDMPKYLAPDGSLFDKSYSKMENNLTNSEYFKDFPLPTEYNTFFEYEQALIDWRMLIESLTSNINLPDITGRHYYRPAVTAPLTELINNHQGKDDKHLDGSIPSSTLDGNVSQESLPTFTIEDPEGDTDPENESDDTPSKSNVLHSRDPWDSQLIPPEPHPYDFDSFESYEYALQRWACLCNQKMDIVPPHAEQLEDLIPIQSQATIEQVRAQRRVWEEKTGGIAEDDKFNSSVHLTHIKPPGYRAVDFFDINETLKRNVETKKDRGVDGELKRSGKVLNTAVIKDPEFKKCIDDIIQTLLVQRFNSHKKAGSFTLPLLPLIHGTFQPSYQSAGTRASGKNKMKISLSNFSGTTSSNGQGNATLPLFLRPLRRLDLTSDMLESCFDCPDDIDGKKVDFDLPIFSIEPLDLSLLCSTKLHYSSNLGGSTYTDACAPVTTSIPTGSTETGGAIKTHTDTKKYIKEKNDELRSLYDSVRHDGLNAWYYPTIPKSFLDQHLRKLDQVLSTAKQSKLFLNSSQFEFSHLREIIEIPFFLDQFQELLQNVSLAPSGSSLASFDTGEPKTILQILLNSITKSEEHFIKFLNLFTLVSSTLTKAKLSFLVQEVLQNSNGKSIMDFLIEKKEIKSLSIVCYAMLFFNELAYDLYPFDEEFYEIIFPSLSLFHSIRDPSVEGILKSTFNFYYCALISEMIQKNSFAYLSIGTKYLPKIINEIIREIAQSLKENSLFIYKKVFPHILNRSARVSEFFSFVFMQILKAAMHGQEKESLELRKVLGSENVALIHNWRLLAQSKFSHVKFISGRIFNILVEDVEFSELMKNYYCKNIDLFFEDLKHNDSRPGNSLSRSRSNLPSLLLNWSLGVLSDYTNFAKASKTVDIEKINSSEFLILNNNIFRFSFENILNANTDDLTIATETISMLLAALMKTVTELGFVVCSKHENVSGVTNSNSHTIVVSFDDVKRLLQMILIINKRSPLCYSVKINLLNTVRHMLKHPDFISLLVQDSDLYNKLLGFCKDGTHPEFNKTSWMLFYQLIKYHHGVLDYLIEKNIFQNFMETITAVSGNIIVQNSLRYIVKLFKLLDSEQKRTSEGKNSSRKNEKDLESIKKDLNLLNDFFCKKRMFIKFHMIYKRFTENENSAKNYPGSPWIELVELYKTIKNSRSCVLLRKDILSHEEYSKGFEAMSEMVAEGKMLGDLPVVLPVTEVRGTSGSLPKASPANKKSTLRGKNPKSVEVEPKAQKTAWKGFSVNMLKSKATTVTDKIKSSRKKKDKKPTTTKQ